MFSYEYFAGLYSNSNNNNSNSFRNEIRRKNCQFFPYKTEFRNLEEVFTMSDERRFSKPWYIGWSNCDISISNILRSHYTKPYFLPEDSESIRTDWIFMGTPGNGAHMHVGYH